MNKVLLANISYNIYGWRSPYVNKKASHTYTNIYPGGESLNFKFDKKSDKNNIVHGYVNWTNNPKQYENGGIIIFFSKNTESRENEIVGIYGNAKILSDYKEINWKGFRDNKVAFNIKASKDLSLLFPIPLKADNYKTHSSNRLVGQIGFKYYDENFAERIIKDEIRTLQKSGVRANELNKLKNIYEYLTNKELGINLDYDEAEQDELISIFELKKRDKLISDLENLEEQLPEIVTIKHKSYKRDNKTVAQLKILRGFKCQICGTKIEKANGGYYIEAAHIKPKHQKGRETPDNIIILCPNHHKEFDYGDRKILKHTKDVIHFSLNGKKYKVKLKIE